MKYLTDFMDFFQNNCNYKLGKCACNMIKALIRYKGTELEVFFVEGQFYR